MARRDNQICGHVLGQPNDRFRWIPIPKSHFAFWVNSPNFSNQFAKLPLGVMPLRFRRSFICIKGPHGLRSKDMRQGDRGAEAFCEVGRIGCRSFGVRGEVYRNQNSFDLEVLLTRGLCAHP